MRTKCYRWKPQTILSNTYDSKKYDDCMKFDIKHWIHWIFQTETKLQRENCERNTIKYTLVFRTTVYSDENFKCYVSFEDFKDSRQDSANNSIEKICEGRRKWLRNVLGGFLRKEA